MFSLALEKNRTDYLLCFAEPNKSPRGFILAADGVRMEKSFPTCFSSFCKKLKEAGSNEVYGKCVSDLGRNATTNNMTGLTQILAGVLPL